MRAATIKIVRAPAYTRTEVSETVRRVAWAARDLRLLPDQKLERLFDRTIEQMTRQDIEDLVDAARRIVSILSGEARQRT
jgi:hypothetical protein